MTLKPIFSKTALLILFMGFVNIVSSQNTDTMEFYEKLRYRAHKHKFTKFLYSIIFVNPGTRRYEPKPLSTKQKKADPNAVFEGRMIRSVNIRVWDPFGHRVLDTIPLPINELQKAGNRFHVNTRYWIIRNILLFKPDEKVQLLKISESERLLRAMHYINDASIKIDAVQGSDSVDVNVWVLDKWSFDPNVGLSSGGGYLRLRDRNFSGLGQTLEQRLAYSKSNGFDNRGNFHITNILNTFISSDAYYTLSRELIMTGISFNRPFYSPLTRWAGGVAANKYWGKFHYTDTVEPLLRTSPLNHTLVDIWSGIGFAAGLLQKSNRPYSKIVLAGRFADLNYQLRPGTQLDTARLNANTITFLGSLGFSLRKYYKDQYIYRFGANEDVPEGILLQGITGIIDREFTGWRRYLGFEASTGRHRDKVGYLYASTSWGMLFKPGMKGNITVSSSLYYFSDVIQKGKWYIRQFVSYKFIQGLNKNPNDKITLKSSEMYGFNAGPMYGTGKMILNLETVAYAPWSIIGFKLAPLVSAGFGIVESSTSRMFHSKVYQAYSLGLLFRNENLLNSSFEITGGYYPYLPDGRRDVFRLNPILSFNLKVRSFAINKPELVTFD